MNKDKPSAAPLPHATLQELSRRKLLGANRRLPEAEALAVICRSSRLRMAKCVLLKAEGDGSFTARR